MRNVATACALLAIVALVGCAGKTTRVGDTTVTTSDDNKTSTVTTSQGSATVGTGAVDVSKLGAPVYPGATASTEGGNYSISTAQGSLSASTFTTPDSFDKVYDYYKAQLPAGSEQMKMTVSGNSTAMFQSGSTNEKVTVSVKAQQGDSTTSITISHTIEVPTAAPTASPAASASDSANSDGGGS